MQSQESYRASITNKSQTDKLMESRDPPKYLSYDKQVRLAQEVDHVAEKSALFETFCYTYAPFLSIASLMPLSFFSWRAGFRGYSLSKYGRSRLMTVGLSFVYPINGGVAVSMWGSQNLMSPFRKEDPWYHGVKYTIAHSIGVFIVTTANLGLTFAAATKSGLLPIPDGVHKPAMRYVASQIFLGRVKPYTRSIVVPAALSTIFMFAVGVGSYHQSCSLLKKLGRNTLIEDEESKS